MKKDLFQLAQAQAEGWTLAVTDGLVSIVSSDKSKNDLTARSHVFNQIMAGSAYHIRAFQIVTAQDVGAIARVPDAPVGSYVKLTETITVPVTKTVDISPATETRWDEDLQEQVTVEVEPARTEEQTSDVTKPTGTLATVRARFGTDIVLAFQDDSEVRFTEKDETTWYPFEVITTFMVYGNYGTLGVDKVTGAVLAYNKNHDEPDGDYSDIVLIDVAELRETLGELPNAIDISLVGFTDKLGRRERADRRAWIDVRLDDAEEVDPTLARFIRAELKKLG